MTLVGRIISIIVIPPCVYFTHGGEEVKKEYVYTIKASAFIMDEILSIPAPGFWDVVLEYPLIYYRETPYIMERLNER
jgi:hypothetical protein